MGTAKTEPFKLPILGEDLANALDGVQPFKEWLRQNC